MPSNTSTTLIKNVWVFRNKTLPTMLVVYIDVSDFGHMFEFDSSNSNWSECNQIRIRLYLLLHFHILPSCINRGRKRYVCYVASAFLITCLLFTMASTFEACPNTWE
jgi:hypothetical protein